ncbi:MAG: ATP-binding protein, partial [Clostridia bacterium]|nr:ATP-binding protein [Clostridia bacterium]
MPDLAALWAKTIDILAADLPRPGLETWLRETRPVAVYENTIVLAVPNAFARQYIEERVSSRLRTALSLLLQRDVRLELVISPQPDESATAEVAATRTDSLLVAPSAATEQVPCQPLNPRYTFDTFVIGSGNRLAHAACLAVAEAPARAYNPLFIYGGVGLGKTHLMQAIAHHVLSARRRLRVAYVSSETFANEMINAIRDRTTAAFRSRYRQVDVLLVDDIQFLAGKESTQEEFFHTFNALHEANRQ